jgi:hypothetical protein
MKLKKNEIIAGINNSHQYAPLGQDMHFMLDLKSFFLLFHTVKIPIILLTCCCCRDNFFANER